MSPKMTFRQMVNHKYTDNRTNVLRRILLQA